MCFHVEQRTSKERNSLRSKLLHFLNWKALFVSVYYYTLPANTLHVCNDHISCIFRSAMASDLDVVNLFLIAGGTLVLPILAFLASFLLWPSVLIKVYYW